MSKKKCCAAPSKGAPKISRKSDGQVRAIVNKNKGAMGNC
jgi:hypothetical protein